MAHKKAGGSSRNGRDTAGRRLGVKLFGGEVTCVLADSGHIAGVVNPPELKKYQFWVNDAEPDTLEEWMASAKETPGSWWPNWLEWISGKSGTKIKAPVPGEGGLSALGDAPGEYVLQ